MSRKKKEIIVSKLSKKFLEKEKKYEYALQAIHSYELSTKYNKDIYKFSETELFECLYDCFQNKGIRTIRSYASAYKKYFNWIETNNYYTISYNYSSSISKIVEKIIDTKYYNFYSRSEIYTKINSFDNAQDGILFALFFEGASGKKNTEILNLQTKNLINTTLFLGSRNIEVPIEFVSIFKNAEKEEKYRTKGANNTIRILNLFDQGYILKKTVKDGSRSLSLISNKLHTFYKNGLNLKEHDLILSGECFYLSVLEQINGKLITSDYNKIINRYGNPHCSNKSVDDLKLAYKNYRKSDKYEIIDKQLYQSICADILGNDLNEATERKADKDIGIAGEKFIYKILIDNYGYENIVDTTKSGTGYDFLLKSGTETMFEIKSTSLDTTNLIFYMTIKEIKMANKNKDNFKLCFLHFTDRDADALYVVPNPLYALNLEKQAKIVLDLLYEGVFCPIETKITIPFLNIKAFKKEITEL